MHPKTLVPTLTLFTCTCLAMLCPAAESAQGGSSQIATTRPASNGTEEPPSDLYRVWVQERPVHVYRCRVSAMPFNQVWPGYQRPKDQTEQAAFAGWDMAGPIQVKVVSSRPVKRVTVRPLASGIKPRLEDDGRTFSFRLERPTQLVVEVNDAHHALHLFADPVETNPCREGDPGVLYFGPGVHQPGLITLTDNQTVYLARGAVVHGTILAKDADHVRVCGRGILDVSRYRREEVAGAIYFEQCGHVQVEGITIRDSSSWTVDFYRCNEATVDWIKLIGLWRYNSDGIDMVSSQHVHISDCFVRSFDDNIVIKRRTGRADEVRYPAQDITAKRCVLWNDWNVAVKIGTETAGPEISDVLIQDCHIIRATHAALGIHAFDGATVYDIHFKNIDMEVGENEPLPVFQKSREQTYKPAEVLHVPRLLDLRVHARHGKSRIENVTLSNISVTSPQMPASRMVGLEAPHGIDGVTFEDVTLNGMPIVNAEEAGLVTAGHVQNVQFVGSNGKERE